MDNRLENILNKWLLACALCASASATFAQEKEKKALDEEAEKIQLDTNVEVFGGINKNAMTGGVDLITNDLFTTNRKIMLLFFVGNEKVNESELITIEKNQQIKKEFRFDIYTEIDLVIIDALTKEQLDKTTIRKSNARDLGGL